MLLPKFPKLVIGTNSILTENFTSNIVGNTNTVLGQAENIMPRKGRTCTPTAITSICYSVVDMAGHVVRMRESTSVFHNFKPMG